MDILIKNAVIFDGKGNPPFKANLAIKKEKIVYIGKQTFSAKKIIDIKELFLAPGFIDTHAHSEFTLLADPRAEGKITQGITTEINGNCGISASPLIGEFYERRTQDFKAYGIKPWHTLRQYISLLNKAKPAINFVTLCGHGNLRGAILGYKNIKPENKDIKKMQQLFKKELLFNVRGLSTGLIYPPGIFSDTEELIELAKTLTTKGIYATHIRSEGQRLLSSLEEAVLIGEKANVPVHISHFKTSGKDNWWKIDSALSIIEDAQKKGIRITIDRYPYIASQTDLDSFLPSCLLEGSKEEIITRLKKRSVRSFIKRYFKEKGEEFLKNLMISDVANEKDRHIVGKTLSELTNLETATNFVCDILIHSELQVGVIYFGMNEENLEKILQKPYTMIGTDAAARCKDGVTAKGKPHPRGFGSFPRFIKKYVLERKLIPLQEAIRRLTYLPAKTFKIEKRGLIKEGYFADIVIFDPAEIQDTATFTEPFNISKGIKYVIVNGQITMEDGVLTNIRNGKVLL